MRKEKIIKRILTVVISFALSLSSMGRTKSNVSQVKAESGISNPRIAEDGTVTWDKISFGSYPQDAEYVPKSIKWRILNIDEKGNAFLLADEGIDCRPYNITGKSCTWETCTLRDWLNGTDIYAGDSSTFINEAFSVQERNAIIDTNVINDTNPEYGTDGGNDTVDKIYLLSISEASNIKFGFNSEKARVVKSTDYAYLYGASQNYADSNYIGNCYWWLRSSGSNNQSAACVGFTGYSPSNGTVNNNEFVVRPVLNINLSSSYVRDAGKVSSDGSVTAGTNTNQNSSYYVNPQITGNITTWDCVYFGKFKQDASFEKKPLEWRVLSVNGNNAFVMAEKAIDCKPYNISNGTFDACTWETCTLRGWLNGIGSYAGDSSAFIYMAFSNQERNAIINTLVTNEDNPINGTDGGNNTNDNIYLLSLSEISNITYGFDEELNTSRITKCATVTDYARLNGSYRNNYNMGWWWLRTPGRYTHYATDVGYTGEVSKGGSPASDKRYSIRPVMHINLSSLYVKNVGTVSMDGGITFEEFETKKKADEVIDLISAIGTVTKDSREAIEKARITYDSLSDEAKAQVTNYSLLQDAEFAYEKFSKNDSGNSKNDNNNSGNNSTNVSGNIKKNQTISKVNNLTKTYSTKKFSLGAVTDGNGKLTYSSSNKKVATVSADGKVTLVGAGKTQITIKASGTSTYNPAEKTITLTVKKAKQKITSKVKTKTMTYTSTPFSLGIKVQGNAKVTYKSSNPKVLTVSNKGKVTLKGIGKATITIRTKQNSRYIAATKKIVITVKPPKVKLLKCTALSDCRVKLSWTNAPVFDGYEIQFSQDSKFSEGYTPIDFKKKENTAILKGGTEGRTYYVRIRPYRKVNGKKVTYAWSNVSSFKTFK